MTREEAIKILKAIRVYECYPKSASEETKEAIDMAIEALSAEPSGDLIIRDDVIEAITNFMKPFIGVVGDMGSTLNAARELIKELPSADAVHNDNCGADMRGEE